jgi:O-antigen ligase
MNLKPFISIANFDRKINFLFIILIFGLPFVSYSFVLNPIKIGQELYIVSVIALWLFFGAMAFFRTKLMKINIVDVCFFGFISYCIIHYYSYSYFGFLYNGFWIFLGYIVLFYLFKWSFDNKEGLFNFTIKLIWILCSLQSIVGLLQEFNFLKSDNEFFKVVGTFINPNFLGVDMMIGLIAITYLFLFQFSKNNLLKFLLFFSAILMIYVLFLTQSRASWIALCVGIAIFLGTSEKSILFLKNNKIMAFGILSAIVLLGISSLYLLYKMNTDSVDGRAFIRKITLSQIEEKPILGNGIFNFTGIYNDNKAHYFLDAKRPWAEIKVGDYVAYVFNDYLQVIFEIGIIGLLLMVLILYFILKDVYLNPKTRFALTLIISFCFLALFTSVLYNPNAMIYTIWALSILVVFGKSRIPIMEVKNQFYIKGFAVFLVGISCTIGTIYYKKTVSLSSFKTIVDSGNQKIYYKLDNYALLYINEDPYVEFQVGYEKYQEGDFKIGLEMMECSVKKNPIPKANVALADLYLQQKKYDRTEQLLKMNVGIEPSRFEPRNNLLQFYISMSQKEKSIKVAHEIINLPVKIKSSKVDIYKTKAEIYLKNNQ